MGALCQRSGLGDRPRGLQRQRRRLDYLPHDLARSKAYRWGEDGIFGVCDRYQLLVFAPAFWNGRDPILKERFFGLTSHEGNHGEDVKEYYYYLDNTPTHSYMKCTLQISAGRVSLRQARRGETPARPREPEYRTDRHRHIRRRPILRHRDRVRQGHDRRHLRSDRGVQPRSRRRHACTSCRISGFATHGHGGRDA